MTNKPPAKFDTLAFAALLGSGICFGAIFVLSKQASYPSSGGLEATQITLFRFLIATLSVPFLFKISRERFVGIRVGELLMRGLCGFLAAYLAAKSVTDPKHQLEVGVAAVLNSTAVIFAPAFAWLILSEPLTRRSWIAIFLAILGIVILEERHIFVPQTLQVPWSELWALVSGVLAGVVVVLIRDMRSGPNPEKPETIVLYYSIVATLGSALLCVIAGKAAWHWPTLTGWLVLLLLGLASFGAQWLMSFGLRLQDTLIGILVLNLQSVVAAVIGSMLFGETYTATVIAGSLIVMSVAIWLTSSGWAVRTKQS